MGAYWKIWKASSNETDFSNNELNEKQLDRVHDNFLGAAGYYPLQVENGHCLFK
jgi:hypothetical protein